MENVDYGVGVNVELGVKTLTSKIVEGFKQVLPEKGPVVNEVVINTTYGALRFKTRPVNPDNVTIIYLNGNRLYKVMVDCRLCRDPAAIEKYVLEKLAKESFERQVAKVLAIPVTV